MPFALADSTSEYRRARPAASQNCFRTSGCVAARENEATDRRIFDCSAMGPFYLPWIRSHPGRGSAPRAGLPKRRSMALLRALPISHVLAQCRIIAAGEKSASCPVHSPVDPSAHCVYTVLPGVHRRRVAGTGQRSMRDGRGWPEMAGRLRFESTRAK
jgi:hypothetical protein